jgi:hypothetical protein
MQPGDPDGRLGRDLPHRSIFGRAFTLRPPSITLIALPFAPLHAYQSSIQVMSCSEAFAMCFSTVLMLRP